MIGDMEAIDDTICALKSKGLVLKIVEGLQDYLPYKIKFSDDKKRAWLVVIVIMLETQWVDDALVISYCMY